MGNPRGFLTHARETAAKQPIAERTKHWHEFEIAPSDEMLARQGARCMDCGVPFCHSGCPLGNLIPDWNDDVYRGRWEDAIEELHATNNFPEFTGRVCPAPCEPACVLGIIEPPVSIKLIELAIIERAFAEGRVKARIPATRTGRRVAVVGAGPAGLAAAAQLNRAGHTVTVFERADRPGGLLMYGIPDFKLEKQLVERRIKLMEAGGVVFRTGVEVGVTLPAQELIRDYHAVLLAGGSTAPRDLPAPGRFLDGIHFAMDFLTAQNRRVAAAGGQAVSPAPGKALFGEAAGTPDEATGLHARGRKVVVIGGGDTGSDCVGTSIRQGAASVTQIEILPKPPAERPAATPWPEWPAILRTSSSHEEGCARDWSVSTREFVGEKRVERLKCRRAEWQNNRGSWSMSETPGSDFEIEADLVLIAMGFVGPEKPVVTELGCQLDARGNVASDREMMTTVDGVFAAGDMRRGQSLVVWAIDEGRRAAAAIGRYLSTERTVKPPM